MSSPRRDLNLIVSHGFVHKLRDAATAFDVEKAPGNGETWFLGQCFALLRKEGLAGVVSFSDPVPRKTADGGVGFPGHVGTIYQAGNGRYLGRSQARTLRLLPDGSVLSDRAAQKVRTLEKGWEYVVALLTRHGAEYSPDLAQDEDHRREWLRAATARVTRPLRHPGNHRYVWPLSRRVVLSGGLPYPKQREAACPA